MAFEVMRPVWNSGILFRRGYKMATGAGLLQAHCTRGKSLWIRIDDRDGLAIQHPEPEPNSLPANPRSNCLS